MGLSQTTIDGTAVPGWGSVKRTLLSIAESFPYVPYVGWDLAVVDEGESEILEMNVNMTSIPSRSIARSYGTSGPSGSVATTAQSSECVAPGSVMSVPNPPPTVVGRGGGSAIVIGTQQLTSGWNCMDVQMRRDETVAPGGPSPTDVDGSPEPARCPGSRAPTPRNGGDGGRTDDEPTSPRGAEP